ncbi:MAG: S53 family peptidase [Terracidiphilus sp.]
MSDARVILPGSYRAPAPGAVRIGPANGSELTHVTVYVRGKEEPLPITRPGHFISNEEYAATYGASANDFMAIRDFAKEFNLTPKNECASTRSIELHGTVANLSRAFGVTLDAVKIQDGEYRHRTGGITIPEKLLPIVRAVLGLDTRPEARPHCRRLEPRSISAAAPSSSFSPVAVGQIYNFPSGLDGTGQTIAVIELAGGFLQSDLVTFFQGIGIKMPSITAVSVGGGKNVVTSGPKPTLDEIEVALDIQIAGALAPGAKQLVYFAPSESNADFLTALNAAITATPQPIAISVSWGSPENAGTAQMNQQFETALQHAAQLGIPVCIASGDDDSFDGTSALCVDFPAAAPHALGCGGTNLVASGNTITSETVWNALTTDENGNQVREGTGGGVSQFFPKPAYQSSVTVPAPPVGNTGGRGVPDVAGDADPATGYQVVVKGKHLVVGGTSAVAPLYAALIARCGQSLGKPVGFLNTLIYQSAVSSKCFQDVTQGDNDSQGKGGLYHAGPGWDPCTGFGSPNGTALLAALKASAPPGGTGSTGSHHPSTGSTGSKGSAHFDFPVLPPPVPAPVPAPPAAPPTLTSILGGSSNSVAVVGVVGLAAIVGLVAAAGIVATVAIAKEKE